MARKDLLKGLMTPAKPGDAPDGKPDTAASPSPPPPRMKRGAIGAVSQSIADLKGRAMIDVPADMIDMAGIDDRLDSDEDGIAALAESIRAYGQQVPVLLRHSPNYEGRYEVVYGRRRVRALKRLGQPVRAMLRELSDRDLIMAQGQENAARRDLSFIEKARFAQQMVQQGFERAIICDALHIDKTVVSRMLTVADALPEKLVRAIGAAPGAGRDRWLALARRIEGLDNAALVKAAVGADSDTRFAAVFAAAGRPALPSREQPVTGADGTPLGKLRRGRDKLAIDFAGDGAAFGEWLLTRIEELHADWQQHRDAEEED